MPHVSLAHDTEAKIAANTDRLSAALASGDGAGIAAVYVDDAFLLPPTGDVISGRDAIERFWCGGIEIGLRAVELKTLERGGAGSVRYEHGHYRMLLAGEDGHSEVERGPYVVVHVQVHDGSWRWAVKTFGGAA